VVSQLNGVYYVDPFTGALKCPPLLVGYTTGAIGTKFEVSLSGIRDPANPNLFESLFMLGFPSAYGGDGALVFIKEPDKTIVNEVRGNTNIHQCLLHNCCPGTLISSHFIRVFEKGPVGVGAGLGSLLSNLNVGGRGIFYTADLLNYIYFYNPDTTPNTVILLETLAIPFANILKDFVLVSLQPDHL